MIECFACDINGDVSGEVGKRSPSTQLIMEEKSNKITNESKIKLKFILTFISAFSYTTLISTSVLVVGAATIGTHSTLGYP